MGRPPRRVSFEEIKLALPGLTPEQRRELGQWCQVGKKKSHVIPLDADDWFADAVGDYLCRKGMSIKDEVRLHLTIVAHRLDIDYHKASKAMREELSEHVDIDDGTSRLWFGRVVVKALVEMLSDQRLPGYLIDQLDACRVPYTLIADINNQFAKRPIDADLLFENVSRVKEALEHELPGYLASGMLPVVLRD